MAQLNVLFEVPNHVQAGLANGMLERVGGVIRDTQSKQVVAWLRDGSLVSANVPFQSLLSISNIALMGSMLNLTFGALNILMIMKGLENLRQSLASFHTSLLNEFKRDRDNTFQVALETARDAYELRDEQQRNYAARHAIDNLKRSRNDFLADFAALMTKNTHVKQRLLLGQALLVRAAYAQTAIARCYLVTDNQSMALEQFVEQLPKFRTYSEQLIRQLIQASAPLYFESSIPRETLKQFLAVQQWLRGEEGAISAETLFNIVDELRVDFWNSNAFGNPLERIMPDSWRKPLLENLQFSLAIIENYQRLEGFDLEMRSMRLSINDWDNLVNEDALAQYGGAIIVDEDALAQAVGRLG